MASCVLNLLLTWLLKKFTECLLLTMTHIINKSLESSVLLNTLKEARVTLLLKMSNRDKTVFKNYCSFSNLAYLSKSLRKFLPNKSLNTGSSTTPSVPSNQPKAALLIILNYIFLALDYGKGVILVLLNQSETFNTIDHDILVWRLQTRIGIEGPALCWFQSYLEGPVPNCVCY